MASLLSAAESPHLSGQQTPSHITVHGDYVAGDKPVGVDQREQAVEGAQTNVTGDMDGALLSGEFQAPVRIDNDQQGEQHK